MLIVGNPVRIGVLLTLSVVAALMLVMTQATPALSQSTSTVRVTNLDQQSSVLHTTLGDEFHYAQSFCTGSVATTLDKVRLYTLSKETDPNSMFYRFDPAPVVTIRSIKASGMPGEVLHTLTNPDIDDSRDTAEDFTSSGYELAAHTSYAVVIHAPTSTGHIAFLSTASASEDTDTQLGWAIGDQYMYHAGHGWTDQSHEGLIMKMAIHASGDLPSISTPAFIDTDCDGIVGPYEFSVDEMSAADTLVDVAVAGDADGDSMTYSVSGTDVAAFNNAFNLDASTGEITVKSSSEIDYESSQVSYSITVSVTDGEDASGVAESQPTTDATTSVRINVIDIDEPGTVTVSSTAPRVGGELTVSVTDPDDETLLFSRVQWSRTPRLDLDFIDIPIDPNAMANPSYTPTAADQSKYLKVTVSYVERSCGEVARFDDRCRGEAEYTFDTLVANEEGLIVQSQVVNINNPATGTVRITGTPRLGWTLETHGRGLADAEGRRGALYFQWIRVDPVTEVEQNVSNPERTGVWWSYVVQEADVGKAIKVRVSFTDNAGNAESVTSDAVDGPDPLTATTRDAPRSHDGSTAFAFELRFSEAPAVGFATVRDHAFTVTGGSLDKVRRLVPGSNAWWEITVTPSSEADVTLALNATTNCSAEGAICNVDGVKLSGVLELVVPWTSSPLSPATGAPTINGTARVGEILTASTSDIADADGLANASFTYQWRAADVDISGATGSSYTVVKADAGKVITVAVSFTDDAGNEESVTSAATAVVPLPPLTASTHDVPESHDGATAFTFELRFSEAPGGGFSATTLRDQALTVSGGTITNVRQLETGKNLKWEITLQPSGNGEVSVILPPTIDCADQGAICTGDGRGLSVGQAILVLGPPNSAASGAPTINGTAQVGEILTASTSSIADTDGVANATFSYQWLADDADISGATGSSYTLVATDAGKVIKVTVSFSDDADNEESVTSAATAAVTHPPLTATTRGAPESHDGATAFTFELRFSESPAASFGFATVQNHAFTVTGGSVSNVSRLEPGKNVRWEITVTPSSDADVTLALNVTTDCSAEGAICTDNGVKLSGALELVVAGPPQNSAASGAPTISGTAQVGQTLIASTSGIADADGVANATFSYQWVADDADISGGTGSSYTLVAADEGKVITVTVAFTDDAGNAESLTSAATTATTAVARPPLTAAVHDEPSSHDGSTAFTFELRLSENIENLSYATLHEHALTVTGGTVDKARRLAAPSNVRWEITVTPASSSDVIIVLPITSDCTAQGAICTEDGRQLSDRVEVTVPGTERR